MLEEMRQKLADEIDRLIVELTVTLPKAIQKAVELGDLSENAEYKSALERQQFVQARLNHLTQRASELSKIDPTQIPSDRVGFGSRVTLEDTGNGEVIEYTIVFGDFRTGADREAAKVVLARATTDLSKLDEAVDALCTKILMLMPDCTSKTVNSLRKHKQWHWDNTSVTNREWLGLNMMTEGKAGFRAFNEGPKGRREVDFIKLRQLLAEGHPWDDELLRAISPQFAAE